MMMGLNKLGTAVTVVIAVTLAALVAEIIYVLWRRRRIYRPRGRVEPKEPSLPTSSPSSSSNSERERQLELELEQQVMKYQCHYGESRMLFTIKEEEEREYCDSENGECSVMVLKKAVAKTASFSELVVKKLDDVAIKVDEFVSETTPFSTPCASSPYYTPHSSPARDNNNKDNNGGNG